MQALPSFSQAIHLCLKLQPRTSTDSNPRSSHRGFVLSVPVFLLQSLILNTLWAVQFPLLIYLPSTVAVG